MNFLFNFKCLGLLFLFASGALAQQNPSALGAQTISLIEPAKQMLFGLAGELLPLGAIFLALALAKKFLLDKWAEEYSDRKMAEKGYVRQEPYRVKYFGRYYVKKGGRRHE